MSWEIIRKDGELTSPDVGVYHHSITVALAKRYAGRMLTTAAIAKVQFGEVNEDTERWVRQRMPVAINMLLLDGVPCYPIYDKGGYHKKLGMKVIVKYNEHDYNELNSYLQTFIIRDETWVAKIKLIQGLMNTLRKQLGNGNGNESQ